LPASTVGNTRELRDNFIPGRHISYDINWHGGERDTIRCK